MAGIPRFDRAEVLLQASRVFADRGYEGTSISHLVAATGLLRGSLYGAFGSKAELFRVAFDESATSGEPSDDLIIDLTVVALRERAGDDDAVAARVRFVLAALGRAGIPAHQQIYRRLLARAGIDGDPATDLTDQRKNHG